MSPIQLLEKLGADGQFNKNQLTAEQISNLIKLSASEGGLVATPMVHDSPMDDEEYQDILGKH